MNQGKTEFGILAKENVSVQTGTDEVAFHHALETDWGGGAAAILFSTRSHCCQLIQPQQRLTVLDPSNINRESLFSSN